MKLVLGTVQFGLDYGINNSQGKPSLENAFSVLDRAYELGIQEIDTADAYGNSTEVISSYLKKYPDKKFKIMSKFIADKDISYSNAFENSCARLGLNSLDGFYFHRFDDFINFSQYEYLHTLKKEGRLHKFAVSLYSLDELKKAVDSNEVDLIQLPFNIFDRSEEKIALLKKAKAKGKLIYIRSAFLQGLFFMDLNSLPEKLKSLLPELTELHKLVKKYGVLMEDLCMQFVAKQTFIDKIIIGVDNINQLEKNVTSLNTQVPDELISEVLKIKINRPELLNPANWKL